MEILHTKNIFNVFLNLQLRQLSRDYGSDNEDGNDNTDGDNDDGDDDRDDHLTIGDRW